MAKRGVEQARRNVTAGRHPPTTRGMASMRETREYSESVSGNTQQRYGGNKIHEETPSRERPSAAPSRHGYPPLAQTLPVIKRNPP